MKTIKLSENVMVSDPCYENPTWCQKKLDSVLSGEYIPFVKTIDTGDWGKRNSVICVVHKDYLEKDLKWTHIKNADIGVDSGQCGIFSLETYRDNKSLSHEWIKGGSPFNTNFLTDGSEEDKWYEKICDLTLSTENSWGSYDNGVVSSSGYGDGVYHLYLSKVKGKTIGIMIDFLVDDKVDFEFYKK